MSYFPDFLQLQRSASNNWAEKSDCQMPRTTMNELIMNYLVTGKAVEINFSSKLKYLSAGQTSQFFSNIKSWVFLTFFIV